MQGNLYCGEIEPSPEITVYLHQFIHIDGQRRILRRENLYGLAILIHLHDCRGGNLMFLCNHCIQQTLMFFLYDFFYKKYSTISQICHPLFDIG